MNEIAGRSNLSRGLMATLIVFGMLEVLLLMAGPRDYPNLHSMLDTGMFLLSSVLVLLFWDLGLRLERDFLKWIAISFAVSALFEFIHAIIAIQWSGYLAPIEEAVGVLRPSTWPPSAHLLPIGLIWAVWLFRRGEQSAPGFVPGLLILGIVLFGLFNWLPQYALPNQLGITRPTLILVPILWGFAGWLCWRSRARDRLMPPLVLMAIVQLVSHLAMLYSKAPHDMPAMLAHLGKIGGYAILLLSVLQMASQDVLDRIRAERALAKSNEALEGRVRERTVQLETANASLLAEIAERKRVEEGRGQLVAIIESSDDAIIGKTMQGIITSWNKGAEKLFGYSVQEAVGNPMLMLFPPERANEEPEILARIGRGESVDHFETVRVRKDGQRIHISATISPVRDVDGKIVGASKIARDITDRVRAEAKLQAQLSRLDLLNQITRATGERQDLQSIFQVVIRSIETDLPIDFGCICLHERDTDWVTVARVGVRSEQLAMSLAMSENSRVMIDENGLSRCLRGQLVYEPDITIVPMPFPQRLAQGGLRSVVMAPLLAESHVFGMIVTGRREANGFTSGECEFLRQLSEHVALSAHQAQLHSALRQAYDDLRQTQQAVMQQERLRALGQMASGIAHDINNAISPVALYTESLLEQETNLSPRARSYLETIQRAIDDVAQTVSRMREFYRQREPQLNLAPVRLNELVPQVVDLTRARWSDMPQKRGSVIKMHTELAPDLPVIMGVASEIREALINLIFNAVDAMPEGGRLTIRTATGTNAAGRHALVEVGDTGVGMDEDTQRRCLEPFFTTKGERGTGLGLAMVYGVLQRHSADMEIESKPGEGTVMRMLLPAYEASVASSDELASRQTIPARRRILVVDDDPLLLRSLCDTLEIDGHTVLAANGGQEGIETFKAALQGEERFDVVITDLGMPNIDGRKLASAIKAASATTPIIMLTGWGQRLVESGDVPEHVDWVLSKPPKLRELREALTRCVPGQA